MIDGKPQQSASGKTLEARNPATGDLEGLFPRCDVQDVDDAVRSSHRAFSEWRQTTVLERAALIQTLADRILDHGEELALMDVRDNGSPIREMRRDAQTAAKLMRYFAGLALQQRGETIPTDFDRLDYTIPVPFGVVARILPFNHPLMFSAAKVAAPLIAGNTIVLKPSEHTSLSTLRFAQIAAEVLPPGVVNVVTGLGTEVGQALVQHDLVRRVAFIGSVPTGLAIQRAAAARTVKTVTLELGGKNALSVFPDADLELAVDGALRGMNFTWQGQSCGSTSRLLVHESLHDEFVAMLASRVGALRSGLPTEETTDTGAIVHRGQYEKVLRYIDIGRSEGSRVVVGGGAVQDEALANGFFVAPTIFDGVSPDSRLAQEEIFGPVLAVMKFRSYDEAVAITNSVSYGLTAGVFTRDLGIANRFARDVEAGYVWINDASRHFPGTPYGGVKDSGIGREEGADELASYTQLKNVNVRFA